MNSPLLTNHRGRFFSLKSLWKCIARGSSQIRKEISSRPKLNIERFCAKIIQYVDQTLDKQKSGILPNVSVSQANKSGNRIKTLRFTQSLKPQANFFIRIGVIFDLRLHCIIYGSVCMNLYIMCEKILPSKNIPKVGKI